MGDAFAAAFAGIDDDDVEINSMEGLAAMTAIFSPYGSIEEEDGYMSEIQQLDFNDLLQMSEMQQEDQEAPQARRGEEVETVPYPSSKSPPLQAIYGTDSFTTPPSEKRIASHWPTWVNYSLEKGRPPVTLHPDPHPGLGLLEETDTGIQTSLSQKKTLFSVCHDVIKSFVDYVINKRGNSCTHSYMLNTCKFLQTHLNGEATAVGVEVSTVRGVVKSHAVKQALKNVKAKHHEYVRETGVDIQANTDHAITPDQKIAIIMTAFVSTRPEINALSSLARVTMVAQFCLLMATMCRGDEIRSLTFAMRFTRLYRALGPGEGTTLDLVINNHAKHNHVGRIEYSAFAPHYNPLEDAGAWLGILMLQRFLIDGEPFPDHLDWKDFANRPVFPSISSYKEEFSDSTMNTHWNLFFWVNGVVSDKVTHQPRRQVQQEQREKLLPEPSLARSLKLTGASTGSDNKNQSASYLTTPQLDFVASVAGGTHDNIKAFFPGYNQVTVVAVLLSVVPGMLEEFNKVMNAWNKAGTHNDRKEQRLYMAKGSIEAVVSNVTRAFQMLAARPINVHTGKLEKDSEPLYKQFQEGSMQLCKHPVFASAEFEELVKEMAVQQEKADSHQLAVSGEVRNALEEIFCSRLEPTLKEICACQNKMLSVQEEQNKTLQRMETLMHYSLLCSSSGRYLEGVVPPRVPLSGVFAGAAPLSFGEQSWELSFPAPVHSVATEFQAPLPANEDTTKGTRKDPPRERKRSRPVRAHQVEAARRAEGTTGSSSYPQEHQQYYDLVPNDRSCVTVEDYWREYFEGRGRKPSLLEAEQVTAGGWRRCLYITLANGKKVKRNAKSVWWCNHVPIFNLFHWYKDTKKLSKEAVLEKATAVFERVPVGRNNRRPLVKPKGEQSVKTEFQSELKKIKAENPGTTFYYDHIK